ncbi:unnamed protein product [Phyllotreta striolata]|uniref:N-acetylglucosamine-6-phosphate deacetylase n=1 Tax=Phyllotreta striolata TaxID=444603 RepID=A0A9N9THY6_PHYSR|nr:unnamed protein product [Phyllotreta striolata]
MLNQLDSAHQRERETSFFANPSQEFLADIPHQDIITKFWNCRILKKGRFLEEDLYVRNGKIIDSEELFYNEKKVPHFDVDCKGMYIAPGLIDLQINGGFGFDFSYYKDTELAVKTVAKRLLSHGVTAFCPTIVTSPNYIYHDILPKIKKTKGSGHGAAVLGVHAEGPFINKEKKGAHPEKFITDHRGTMLSIKEAYGSHGYENIAIITLAPELRHTDQIIRKLKKDGIVVSLGHTTANLTQSESAVKHGATFITHLFNAMLPFHHRDPGIVGLLSSDQIDLEKLYYGIISDGIHTHACALRMAHKVHPNGMVLITDALSALGLSDGRHTIGQMDIEIKNGVAYIAGTNTLCGSTSTMLDCVKFFHKSTGCSMAFALQCASWHPAKVLHIEKQKGTLEVGADADFIIINEYFDLFSTWVAGEMVHKTTNL